MAPAELVLAALRRHALIPDDPGWTTAPATGGSTEHTFVILDPSGRRLLTARLAQPDFGDWLRHEEAVLSELTGTGCAPRLVGRLQDEALPDGGLLVHAYLPGAPAPLVEVTEAAREALMTCLAAVHRHPRAGYTIWPSLEVRRGPRSQAFRDRIAAAGRFASARTLTGAAHLLERLRALPLPAGAGWDEPDFTLIHGDLSYGNLLWDSTGVALIDWAFARDGDPAEDLAYLISEQDLPPELIADLAEAYVGAGGDPWALARLPAWLPLVTLDAALWWADHRLAHAANPATDPDITARLERAARYLDGSPP